MPEVAEGPVTEPAVGEEGAGERGEVAGGGKHSKASGGWAWALIFASFEDDDPQDFLALESLRVESVDRPIQISSH